MTLVETIFAVAVLALSITGLLSGLMIGVRLNYASAQQTAAFGLCVDLYEQMRGDDYDDVTVSNYPVQTLRMTHLGGSQRIPIHCTRLCRITNRSNPARKEVKIDVNWTYLGKPLSESLSGMLFKKL